VELWHIEKDGRGSSPFLSMSNGEDPNLRRIGMEREREGGGGGIIVYKIFIKRKSSKLGGYEIKFCNKTCFRGEKKIFIGGNLNAGKIMIINFAY